MNRPLTGFEEAHRVDLEALVHGIPGFWYAIDEPARIPHHSKARIRKVPDRGALAGLARGILDGAFVGEGIASVARRSGVDPERLRSAVANERRKRRTAA